MKVLERFLSYVSYYTTSDPDSLSHPTSSRQFDLANALANELTTLGVSEVSVSDTCYVYGMIPATKGYEQVDCIGFIAHMDTAPDASGEHVRPQVIENYDGNDVVLKGSNDILSTVMFPHLTALKGRTLITTDGTTLLGADDKAGVAEIMTACEQLLQSDIEHGAIAIAFTPDEEVGQGMDCFELDKFPAKYAYTVDGGAEGEIEFENFNAASATITITGVNVHPGDAKDTMINAALLACQLADTLPKDQTPATTEGYEGFYHLTDISGTVNQAVLSYIIREHDVAAFEEKRQTLIKLVDQFNEKHGANTAMIEMQESYLNMAEKIRPCYHIIEKAEAAIKAVSLLPVTNPIRGGTDGARLSYMGIPCPNLGTGGYAYHGKFEHITAEGMEISTQVVLELIKEYAKK